MRIKEGFVLREVAGQGMVIAIGEASKTFHGLIKLNTTGCIIWKGIEAGKNAEQIASEISVLYNVSSEDATRDVEELFDKMKEAGFIVED